MQPKNMDEYLELCQRNERITGFGMDTTIHIPCPFCASPDFMIYRVIDAERAMNNGGTCKQCGRSAKFLFTFEHAPGGGQVISKKFEMVQTSGDPQPEWLNPKMRRLGWEDTAS